MKIVTAVVLFVLLSWGTVQAQTFKSLYNFTGGSAGEEPAAGLVRDGRGNLYGTTFYGGDETCSPGEGYGCGTVFRVAANGTETVLHSFTGTEVDGALPFAGLIQDAKGNLYGTTYQGGSSDCYNGCGTVFRVAANGTETVLHSFTTIGNDGLNPVGGLVRDEDGNLYGTTSVGGTFGYGTVFKLTANGMETVLHSFTGTGGDGIAPESSLVQDGKGSLYGTTIEGGSLGYGTVFKVAANGTETVLYSFTGTGGDGENPYAGLVRDAKGNLYGTTRFGGTDNDGTVFRLATTGKETVLYSFTGLDGADPESSLVQDWEGNLYGTSMEGGSFGYGTVFKISANGGETVLLSFDYSGTEGGGPIGGLVQDGKGNLYGTTSMGGYPGYGTVFELIP